MAEDLITSRGLSKAEKYQELMPQLKALIEPESDFIANVANTVAALKQAFGFLWIGVYFVKDKELVLGPFQGPVACTRIGFGKGVCGKSWEDRAVMVVDDVDQFPGHIACSSASRSEIVVPAMDRNGKVFMVLDVDSDRLSAFDDVDRQYLGDIVALLGQPDN